MELPLAVTAAVEQPLPTAGVVEVDEVTAPPLLLPVEAGLTVLSCNWMSIMWSPRRMLRFRGVLPLRKSFTCESLRDSSACITVFSGR